MLRPRHLPVLGVVAIAVLAATTGHATASSAGTAAAKPDGGRIWLADCATCHGVDGTGTPRGPDISTRGTADVDFVVRTGRMPVSSPDQKLQRGPSRYDEAQIAALVDHTAGFISGPKAFTPSATGTDVARGGELYLGLCAACHQSAGAGGALAYGDTAPPLYQATRREIGEAIRVGPGDMPDFAPGTLDASQVADVSAYVRHLRHPGDRGGADLGHLGPVPEGLVAWLFGLGAIVAVTWWLGTTWRQEQSEPALADAGDGDGDGDDGG